MTPLLSSLIRGETYSLALEAIEGEIAGATARADLKRSLNGAAPPDDAPVVATFSVDQLAEVTPGGGPGWVFTLEPGQTSDLEAGSYVADARIELANGFVEQADPVRINVKNRVTT